MANEQFTAYCPSCDHKVTEAEINITEGVALCAECGTLSRLSDFNFLELPAEEIIRSEPKGVQLRSDRDQMSIKLSLFSLGSLLGFLFITLFWNGITGLFLSLAVAAACYNTIGYVPDWLAVPGLENGKPVMNDQVMGGGITVFFCLFLTPFVVIGAYMFISLILILFGSITIMIDKNRSYVSTGILFISRKRYFDPHKVKNVQIGESKMNREHEGNNVVEMEIEGMRRIRFGSLLSVKKKDWVMIMLRQILVHKRSSSRLKHIPHLYWLK